MVFWVPAAVEGCREGGRDLPGSPRPGVLCPKVTRGLQRPQRRDGCCVGRGSLCADTAPSPRSRRQCTACCTLGSSALHRAASPGAMHRAMLHLQEQCTTPCCTPRSNALPGAANDFTAPRGATCCTTMHRGEQCNALPCTHGSDALHWAAHQGAVHCPALQGAMHCATPLQTALHPRGHCAASWGPMHCTALHCTALQGATHCTVQRCTSLSNALHCAAPRGAMTCPALHAGSNALHRTATDFAAPQGAMHCLSTALRCAAPQGATRCLELQARQRCIAPCIMHCMLGSRCAVLHCAVMHPHCTPQSTALRHAALHHKERCAACAAHCRALHSPAPRYTARQAVTCCPAQHCAVTSAALHP